MPEDKPKKMGSRALLRVHFLNNIGKVMDSDELREVAGISEWARRVREIRNEEGYLILTRNDRNDLKPGEYLLESAKPQPAFERSISKELRALVLDRNGFTCQMCGAVAGEPHLYDETRKTRLHLACSKPPAGHARWTLRLLADHLVEIEVIESISHQSVRTV